MRGRYSVPAPPLHVIIDPQMKRALLIFSIAGVLVLLLHAQTKAPFNVVEATIPQMRAALKEGQITSRELVTLYLARIGMYDAKLHAVITTNPHALDEAAERDRELAQGRVRGPLHGIPIALKDNVLTHDIVTTGGALAFDGFVPPYDATLVKNLRDAGAIIIAKTGLSELANWVAGGPTPMPGNYNAVG